MIDCFRVYCIVYKPIRGAFEGFQFQILRRNMILLIFLAFMSPGKGEVAQQCENIYVCREGEGGGVASQSLINCMFSESSSLYLLIFSNT